MTDHFSAWRPTTCTFTWHFLSAIPTLATNFRTCLNFTAATNSCLIAALEMKSSQNLCTVPSPDLSFRSADSHNSWSCRVQLRAVGTCHLWLLVPNTNRNCALRVWAHMEHILLSTVCLKIRYRFDGRFLGLCNNTVEAPCLWNVRPRWGLTTSPVCNGVTGEPLMAWYVSTVKKILKVCTWEFT